MKNRVFSFFEKIYPCFRFLYPYFAILAFILGFLLLLNSVILCKYSLGILLAIGLNVGSPVEVAFILIYFVLAFFIALLTLPLFVFSIQKRKTYLRTFIVLWVGVTAFFLVQQKAYRSIHADRLSEAAHSSNRCPWISLSGAEFVLSRVTGIPDGLGVDFRNEECTALGLIVDQVSWSEAEKALYSNGLPDHYAQVTPLILALVIEDSVKQLKNNRSREEVGMEMWERMIAVLEKNQARLGNTSPGINPVANIVAPYLRWEEGIILRTANRAYEQKISSLLAQWEARPSSRGSIQNYRVRAQAIRARWEKLRLQLI